MFHKFQELHLISDQEFVRIEGLSVDCVELVDVRCQGILHCPHVIQNQVVQDLKGLCHFVKRSSSVELYRPKKILEYISTNIWYSYETEYITLLNKAEVSETSISQSF